MTSLNYVRHVEVFDPEKFNSADMGVDIIGCGSIGSHIAYLIGKYGVDKVRLWDDDIVEDHNLTNQMFLPADAKMGETKARAVEAVLKSTSGTQKVEIKNEKYTGQEPLHEYVFVCTDTMASRQEIWAKAIKYKPNVKLMVEVRLNPWDGRVYAIAPMNPKDIKFWEAKTNYDDKSANVSMCGGKTTLVSTSVILSGLAVNQFVRSVKGDAIESEILLGLADVMVETTFA